MIYPIKINLKLNRMLETDMNKLLVSNRQLNPVADPNSKIAFRDAPFIQYEQIQLNDE